MYWALPLHSCKQRLLVCWHSGAVPTGLNQLYLSSTGGGLGSDFYGKVKQLQVYNTALTDEQLLQLTGESGTDFYESYAEMAAALTYTIQ